MQVKILLVAAIGCSWSCCVVHSSSTLEKLQGRIEKKQVQGGGGGDKEQQLRPTPTTTPSYNKDRIQGELCGTAQGFVR